MYVVIVIGVVAFMGFYYWRYFANIKNAGGREAAGRIYWREQFGLPPDEDVVSLAIGQWYLGPLVPETMRSLGERVMDVLSRTTYRGAMMWIAFTSKGRLALAVEPTDEGPRPATSSIGMPKGYAPLAVLGDPQPRPWIETAAEAWPGSDQLPRDSQKPSRANTWGEVVRQELVRVRTHDGGSMTFFVEGSWVPVLHAWSRGGPVHVDPRWKMPAQPGVVTDQPVPPGAAPGQPGAGMPG